MADALLTCFRQTLPEEVGSLLEPYLEQLERGQYDALLASPAARALFGHASSSEPHSNEVRLRAFPAWSDFLFHRLGQQLSDRATPAEQHLVFLIGYAALLAWLQSTVTGPPLPFSSARLLFPSPVAESKQATKEARQALLASLSVDGIAAYRLTPSVELLCLADAVMTCPPVLKKVPQARWAKARCAFVQQSLLSEVSSTLQELVYDDLDLVWDQVRDSGTGVRVEFLLERATIHIHHGLDKLAREDLQRAKEERGFEFALTGLLGKRTRFQQKDVSQLVVLARTAEPGDQREASSVSDRTASIPHSTNGNGSGNAVLAAKPENLDLNDDTLLESISFSEKSVPFTGVQETYPLPPSLALLDPSNQPKMDALDSAILLSLASSITNTSPQHGLTREETLPYATRVLDGGSSNWQIYTQALLVRSRIEGYKSRTVERGLLQLQALVDQVIADTMPAESAQTEANSVTGASTFLPKAKESESAPASERLRYIFQLASPTRWDLEAELAARWVQLGGLRSALEIYERLEMWAEAALCWAATDREDKAKKIVRRRLFHATNGGPDVLEGEADEDEKWEGPVREPPPLDAPRLYCILGDLDQDTAMYEKAWGISKQRYARAQRSLGRHYFSAKDFVKAAEAYSKSLKVNQLNQQSWFALGCALLELAQFVKAVEAFSRCVQLDDADAEAWSNLAAALLRLEPVEDEQADGGAAVILEGEDNSHATQPVTARSKAQTNRQDALKALKRAASLKHHSYRIWENVLIVAASLSPPDYTSILAAQKRIIDLRGPTDGERCIDFDILELLIQHVISSADAYDPVQPGLARMAVKFIDESVVPLITASAPLWRLVSKLALWRNRPSSALDAEEKAWRAVTSQPNWETESEERWDEVVEATVRLCDSYESLGHRERTVGLGAGELVAKDWSFKARSAVRGIMSKGRDSWEGSKGWERLREAMEGLKG